MIEVKEAEIREAIARDSLDVLKEQQDFSLHFWLQ